MSAGPMQIRCPTCGANTPLGAQELFLTCQSCDSRLVSFRGLGQRHYMLPNRLDTDQAAASLVQELESRHIESMPEEAEAVCLALPYWRIEAGRRTHFLAAHASPYPETGALTFSGGEELLPFDPLALEGVEVLPPGIPPHLQGTDTRQVPVDLIHVPVWLLRYRLDGESYHAIVHGGTGELLDFAGPRHKGSPWRLASELLGFLLLYTLLAQVLPPSALWGIAFLSGLLASFPPPFLREMR